MAANKLSARYAIYLLVFKCFKFVGRLHPNLSADDRFHLSGFIGIHFAFYLRRTQKSLSYRIDLILMIHVEETILDQNTITIKLEGVLDQSAIPVIQSVFDRYLESHRAIHLDLEGLIHITREGRSFLNGIKQNARLTNLPEFMQLDNSPRRG
jgi:hypothetical protein